MTALLLAVPLVFAAPVPKELKKDTPALKGTWDVTGIKINGQAMNAIQPHSVWTFDGDSLGISGVRGTVIPPRAIKIDPEASPKRLEFTDLGNALGIYEIKDDTLTIALTQTPGGCPKDFTGTAPNEVVYILARSKDRPKEK